MNRTVSIGLATGMLIGVAIHIFSTKKLKPEPTEDLKVTQDTRKLVSLLYRVAQVYSNLSKEKARQEGIIHRGITCNHCQTSPVKGIRYKCANCVDYDICENCEDEQVHISTHVFLKIRIPIPPLANPRSALISVLYPGNNLDLKDLDWEKLKELQKRTHFDQVELQGLYEQFRSLSTVNHEDGGIDRETFDQCLGPLERNLITERIFQFFDQDQDGIINFSELVSGLSILCKGTLEEKIQYAFKGYDLDNDGFISKEELHKMFKAYFYLSMELVRDVVRALEEDLMENFDDQENKPISSNFTAPIPSNSLTAASESGINESNSSFQSALGYQELSPTDKYYPIMQTMSQDAIEEMVEKTFKSINKTGNGLISFEEFVQFVHKDATLIAWFEALGTIF